MSPKISSKNLSYNDSLPPFLAALRAQASGATGPSPLLAAQRRTAKKRSGSEEAEDRPLVVDEDGNVVDDVQTDKDGVVTAAGGYGDATRSFAGRGGEGTLEGAKEDGKPSEELKSAIGSAAGKKKRKVGKVLGQDDNEAASDAKQKTDRETDQEKSTNKAEVEASNTKSSSKVKGSKGKAKKIKLSFDDGEG